MKRIFPIVLISVLLLILSGYLFVYLDTINNPPYNLNTSAVPYEEPITYSSIDVGDENFIVDLNQIPQFTGNPYIILNNNIPYFPKEDMTGKSWENYSNLDYLGRCGVTYASIGKDIMPTKPRGEIGMIKPSGWKTAKYDNVDGKYLYNRCHLIGFQLTGENANEKNLVTGTRFMNVQGMLPFENMVADYVKETKNHVLYRVTPIFYEDNLVCHGVQMEAYSVEDCGEGICFNVFCYNVQPDIAIDYATGDSEYCPDNLGEVTYILNISSHKFHKPDCDAVNNISENNRADSYKTKEELIAQGYSPCGNCNP